MNVTFLVWARGRWTKPGTAVRNQMKRPKQKGTRCERELAEALVAAGINAERVPLSGSIGGKYSADVVIGSIDTPLARIECKYRESISKLLWEWLVGVDFLVVRKNHCAPLFVMTQDSFTELWNKAHGQVEGTQTSNTAVRLGDVGAGRKPRTHPVRRRQVARRKEGVHLANRRG